jgi:hypothetical protein
MTLPASQQRVLDAIESALKRREPRLASMFAIFTRLSTGEGLPRTEVLEVVPWWSPRRYRRVRVPVRVALLLSIAVALVISAVFLGMSQSRLGCTTMPLRAPAIQQAHTRTCPAAPQAKGFGHGP